MDLQGRVRLTHECIFSPLQLINVIIFMGFISLTVRDLRGLPDQLETETETVFCGPADLMDGYFRL